MFEVFIGWIGVGPLVDRASYIWVEGAFCGHQLGLGRGFGAIGHGGAWGLYGG